ncbi:MAG: WecB/TagA/CpsF family glycosyltransferase [Armatimonadota bacterium]
MSDYQPAILLGLPIYAVSRAEALECVEGFVSSDRPHLVITADASALMFARSDPEFAEVFKQASLVTADGAGVVKALRLAGHPIGERCSGVDLVVDIAQKSAGAGWKLFFLGAAPSVAEAAAKELQCRFPGLEIAGCNDGFFKDDSAIIEKIRQSGADILFVAMGMPRQEKWFWKHRDELGVKVGMGVGGTFDVLSGGVKRAPAFFQKHGLEWLYRFIMAPKKSSRKIVLLPVFALLACAEARRRRNKQ